MAFIVDSTPRDAHTPHVVTGLTVSTTGTHVAILTRNAEHTASAFEVQGFTRTYGQSPYRLRKGDVTVTLTDH